MWQPPPPHFYIKAPFLAKKIYPPPPPPQVAQFLEGPTPTPIPPPPFFNKEGSNKTKSVLRKKKKTLFLSYV